MKCIWHALHAALPQEIASNTWRERFARVQACLWQASQHIDLWSQCVQSGLLLNIESEDLGSIGSSPISSDWFRRSSLPLSGGESDAGYETQALIHISR